MNGNGLCATEIDDFCAVRGQLWADLWPDEARQAIVDAYPAAAAGQTVRFRAFCPTAKGTPRWWDVTVSPVTDDGGDHAGYLSVSRDITETEDAREALEIAAAEMKHRLKNTYAMIGSLLIGFAKGHPANEAFAHDMADRLVTLSRAQALFVADDVPLALDRLIPALVAPFDRPPCSVTLASVRRSNRNRIGNAGPTQQLRRAADHRPPVVEVVRRATCRIAVATAGPAGRPGGGDGP